MEMAAKRKSAWRFWPGTAFLDAMLAHAAVPDPPPSATTIPSPSILRGRRRIRCRSAALAPCLLLSVAAATPSVGTPDDPSLLTVERIFGKEEFKTRDWSSARWLKNASAYTSLEKSASFKNAKDLMRHDPESGRSEVLVGASQ